MVHQRQQIGDGVNLQPVDQAGLRRILGRHIERLKALFTGDARQLLLIL
jgi:hypothetical protein